MFKRLRFHYRLFIFFSAFTFVILLIFGIVFYFYSVSIIERNISESQKQTTQKLQEQLDSILDEMDRISIAVNSSQYIMDIFSNIPDNTEENYFDINPKVNGEVKNALFSYSLTKTIKGRISLISKNYDYIDLNNKVGNRQVTKDYIRSIKSIADIMASNKYKVYLPPHIDAWSSDNDEVFTVARPLRDNYGVNGLVEVSRSIGEIDNICSSKDITKNIYVCIFDENKNLIYNNFKNDTGIEKKPLYDDIILSSDFGSYIVSEKDGGKLIASYSRLSNVNWTVVQFEDMEAFREPINALSRIILITDVIVFAVLLTILYIFTGSLTKPIRSLKESLANVDFKDLKLVFEHKGTNNEILLLSEAFQNLLSEVKENTDMMLQSHEREVKAHMLALQAQMNPHFLYNTLAVIGAYGQSKGNAEVVGMCADLSEMLRYTVDFNDKDTDLRSEIKQVDNYLKLMSKRFAGFLKYDINIDPVLFEIKVPKLILEPIIENAFQHGFIDVEPPWEVNVEGIVRKGYWHVCISNNGRRFDDETVKRINSTLENARKGPYAESYPGDAGKGGLGLINTFMRMNIFYKGKEYVNFANLPEKGVEVVIGGPLAGIDGGLNV